MYFTTTLTTLVETGRVELGIGISVLLYRISILYDIIFALSNSTIQQVWMVCIYGNLSNINTNYLSHPYWIWNILRCSRKKINWFVFLNRWWCNVLRINSNIAQCNVVRDSVPDFFNRTFIRKFGYIVVNLSVRPKYFLSLQLRHNHI